VDRRPDIPRGKPATTTVDQGVQSAPATLFDWHVEFGGHTPPSALTTHFRKQYPPTPGGCVVQPVTAPVTVVGRLVSQVHPVAQATPPTEQKFAQ
jgi:hypothetical protein